MFTGKEFLGKGKNDTLLTGAYFTDYIYRRVNKQNKNFLALIQGPTGSGKSYACLRFAEILDKNFNANRIVFSVEEFMDILNNPAKYNMDKGSVMVFEEVGIGMAARQFMRESNRLFNFVMQSFRHKNYVVFFNTPIVDFLDVQSRRMLHCLMTTGGINETQKYSILKPFFLVQDLMTGSFLPKYFRIRDSAAQKTLKITQLHVKLPSKELIKQYELKKNKFTHKLNRAILEKVKGLEVTCTDDDDGSEVLDDVFPADAAMNRIVERDDAISAIDVLHAKQEKYADLLQKYNSLKYLREEIEQHKISGENELASQKYGVLQEYVTELMENKIVITSEAWSGDSDATKK